MYTELSDPRSVWFSARKGQVAFSFFVEVSLNSLNKPSCKLLYYCNSSVATILHFPKESLPYTVTTLWRSFSCFLISSSISQFHDYKPLSSEKFLEINRLEWILWNLSDLRPNLKGCTHLKVPRNNELQTYRLDGKEKEVSEQYPNQTRLGKPVVETSLSSQPTTSTSQV